MPGLSEIVADVSPYSLIFFSYQRKRIRLKGGRAQEWSEEVQILTEASRVCLKPTQSGNVSVSSPKTIQYCRGKHNDFKNEKDKKEKTAELIEARISTVSSSSSFKSAAFQRMRLDFREGVKSTSFRVDLTFKQPWRYHRDIPNGVSWELKASG